MHHFGSKQFKISILLVALGLAPSQVRAGGFDLPVLGPAGVGRGGAVTAAVDDLTAIEINPAALARLHGTQLLLAAGPLFNQVAYRRAPLYDWSRATSSAPPPAVQYGQIENEISFFPLAGAFLGAGSDFGLQGWMFAVSLDAPTEVGDFHFPEDGPQRYQMVERHVMLANYSLAAAYSPATSFGLGLSLHYVDVPLLRIKMVADADNQTHTVYPDRSPYDVMVTTEGADRFGMTATVGAWWRPIPSFELALAGKVLPVPINAEGTMKLEGKGDLLAGKTLTTGYKGPDGKLVPDDTAAISFTYAPSARLGMRYLLQREQQTLLDLELDLTWEGWSVMDAYTVKSPPIARIEELDFEVPLEKMVVARNWQDVWGVRLGGEYALLPNRLGLRLGGFYETGAVPLEYSYLDFLSFDRLGLGGGLALKLGWVRVEAAYMHVFVEPRAVSENEGGMIQLRPGAVCKAPYTGAACDPHYPGKQGAVINAGTFMMGYDLFSLGINLDWEQWLGRDGSGKG